MRVYEIQVSAGRTFNHPYEQYSNIKPGLVLKAVLLEGDEPEACTKALQADAERLIEERKELTLRELREADVRRWGSDDPAADGTEEVTHGE